ncbi:tetratricopeptide repeat protein [Methylovirgula sp. 4M-Z18]|uniref:tetratricopeptide repeat protein n=1 Tax=Methylovirgula sp. 4M-Z18 TaxID=2293567 RepID=UPI0013147A05|nr:tetratricopeptide repeat protein [Methylovirgula sp. 4M-Z18]
MAILVGIAFAQPAAAQTGAANDLAACRDMAGPDVALPACRRVSQNSAAPVADRVEAYTTAGTIQLAQPATATADFTEALKLDPSFYPAYTGRAMAELMQHQLDKADADLQKASALNQKGDPETFYVMGLVAEARGDHEAKIAYMSKILAVVPDSYEAYSGRGNGYLAEGKYDQAVADLKKAVALNPDAAPVLKLNLFAAYTGRGTDRMAHGQPQSAVDDFTQAITLDPQSATAFNNRGDAYNMMEEYGQAIQDLTKSIELDRNYAVAYLNRGVSYIKMHQPDQAIKDLTRAIALDGERPLAYLMRGEAYIDIPNKAAALDDFRRGLALTPETDPDRALIQAEIYNLSR